MTETKLVVDDDWGKCLLYDCPFLVKKPHELCFYCEHDKMRSLTNELNKIKSLTNPHYEEVCYNCEVASIYGKGLCFKCCQKYESEEEKIGEGFHSTTKLKYLKFN